MYLNKFLITTFLLLGVFSHKLNAQYNNSAFANFENTGKSISVNGDFEAGSSGFQNEIMNRLLFGGFIDTKIKDASLKNMSGYNRLGIMLNYDLNVFFGKNPKYCFLIGVKDNAILNATYTKDLYTLLMYGNKPFLNQTVNFSGTNVTAMRFQEIKFGGMFHNADSTSKIGISVSFIRGEQLFYVRANQNSSLYTNSDGTALTLQTNFNMAMSDTSKKKDWYAFNGMGASADLFFESPYKSKIGSKSVLTINANNIGFIHWNEKSVQYNSDSVIKFDGYHVNNILDIKDSALQKINGDSIIRNLTHARREEFNSSIPTNLIIINKIYFGKKVFALSTGFRYLFSANYKPYLFIEPEFNITCGKKERLDKFGNPIIKSRFSISVHIGYGGYTLLNTGLSLSYNTKGWFIKLGSNALQGYIAPEIAYGQGLFFSLARKF